MSMLLESGNPLKGFIPYHTPCRSKTQMTAEIIKDAPCLLTIGCFCIGTNQVDLDAALSKGVNSMFSFPCYLIYFRFQSLIPPFPIVEVLPN